MRGRGLQGFRTWLSPTFLPISRLSLSFSILGMCSHTEIPMGNPRDACVGLDPEGFYIRRPPEPHCLTTFITPEDQLFKTIHMGAAIVDAERYSITIDGLVRHPFSLSLQELKQLPSTTVTAFHECYGSPVKPPTDNVWKIGNVEWTGVRLRSLLDMAEVLPEARYIWSDGLDCGEFAGVHTDRYQKDLPIEKATSPEVLLAYKINGAPLSRERGGPVRLVVPGWFGTNMTKWLCRLSLQPDRAQGPFTTTFYNERDPTDSNGRMRPVWRVEPNSMIVTPARDAQLEGPRIEVEGWAWSDDVISAVQVSTDGGVSWLDAIVEPRHEFSWQKFNTVVSLSSGLHQLVARATSSSGLQQPLSGRRNHAHTIKICVMGTQF
jgi:DMSO/TMAO reductase YedYZ molybdopterin-dependent catalytic subunit